MVMKKINFQSVHLSIKFQLFVHIKGMINRKCFKNRLCHGLLIMIIYTQIPPNNKQVITQLNL